MAELSRDVGIEILVYICEKLNFILVDKRALMSWPSQFLYSIASVSKQKMDFVWLLDGPHSRLESNSVVHLLELICQARSFSRESDLSKIRIPNPYYGLWRSIAKVKCVEEGLVAVDIYERAS